MPVVTVRTSVTLSPKQTDALSSALGRAISLAPGKDKASLLIFFEGGKEYRYAGAHEGDVAHLRVAMLHHREHLGYQQLTPALTSAVSTLLSIPPERVMISYEDIDAWGVGPYTVEG
ncbi:MAG: hypothetical protein SO046_03365 [Actinomyces urogenitalis]|uniref:hypothetical protein n=1 Tax=Actinomyces urogenitalis TaxID=103621 RepID=UPI002A83FE56|nr:hypothetical protein [Actinomyces urogenitalis]MDY3678242.1 hypothetical protein [Actinomyces urogenitalis]